MLSDKREFPEPHSSAPHGEVPTLSVIVPVYNSEATLPLLIERLQYALPTLSRAYEVILIDDGSRDQSWQVITQLAQTYAWVRGIHMMRNYGQHNALLCGIRAARYEIIVTIDDDLQNPPEEIGTLLSKLAEGYDVVYGTPQKEQHGLWRDLASQATKLALQKAMGADTARNVSAFRAFRALLRAAFENYQSPYVSIDVILTWSTTRFAAVKVRHDNRAVGVSNYTFRKLITHALNMLTGFSTLPLKLANFVGFGLTIFGIGILIYVVGRFMIQGASVPGFAFLASIIAIFSGAQLFALGIMGEYMARMHVRMMERPAYAVRETIGNTSQKQSGLPDATVESSSTLSLL